MALRPQQVGALVAIILVVCLLVLMCVAAFLGRPGEVPSSDEGGVRSDDSEEGASSDTPASEEDDSVMSSYSSERGPSEEAAQILRSYEEQGDCVLREAGYIDLFGNSWTCTIQGPGWVDVCLVSGRAGDDGVTESSVRVIHMDVGDWGKAYGQALG